MAGVLREVSTRSNIASGLDSQVGAFGGIQIVVPCLRSPPLTCNASHARWAFSLSIVDRVRWPHWWLFSHLKKIKGGSACRRFPTHSTIPSLRNVLLSHVASGGWGQMTFKGYRIVCDDHEYSSVAKGDGDSHNHSIHPLETAALALPVLSDFH